MMTETAAYGAGPGASPVSGRIRVWDPLVRIFHWSLVAAFAAAWLTAEESQSWHEIAGYTVGGLVAFRLIWGLVGGRYARFSQFLRGPSRTLAYLGDMARGREPRYLGHNPAGAAMIVALLVALAGTAFSGWLLERPERVALLPGLVQIAAPAHAQEDDDDAEYGPVEEGGGQPDGLLKEVHETFANLMLVLLALHVGGVVLASFRHRENLARAMITGDKRAPGPGDVA